MLDLVILSTISPIVGFSTEHIVAQILCQVAEAKHELEAYAPTDIDWYQRAKDMVQLVCPRLVSSAHSVKSTVNAYLNSPQLVRQTWESIKAEDVVPPSLVAQMDSHIDHEAVLLAYPSGALISKLVESALIESFNDKLRANGASDFPDLYSTELNYDGLPVFTRRAGGVFGAAMKGGRPVRVPDGIEIKTVRVGAGIDCHYPHIGLHYLVIYGASAGAIQVTDIRLGFARQTTYRISERNTEATTVKASFSPSVIRSNSFISILDTDSVS